MFSHSAFPLSTIIFGHSITTATPTSARHPQSQSHAHAHFAPSPSISTSRTPPPPNSSSNFSSAGNHPQRQSSLGRAAQKFIEAFGSDVRSPNPSSGLRGEQDAEDDEDDDERYKGHPTRSGSGNTIIGSSVSSGRFTPTSWFGGSGSGGGRRKSEGGGFTGRFFGDEHEVHRTFDKDTEEIDFRIQTGDDSDFLNASRESILEDLDGNEILERSRSADRFLSGKGKARERPNSFLEQNRSPIFDEDEEEEEESFSLGDDKEKEKGRREKNKDRRRSNLSFSGRKTPRVYRPLNEQGHQARNDHRNDNGWMRTAASPINMDRSESEISIPMSPPGGSSSLDSSSMRLATPQARRGAINLNQKLDSRRRRQKQRKNRSRMNAGKPPKPTFSQDLKTFLQLFKSFLLLFLSPKRSFLDFISSFKAFLKSIDDSFRDPITNKRTYKPTWFEAYVPLLIWLGISLSSTIIVLTFHSQVFGFLDRLAKDLREAGWVGKLILGGLIFLTTFPPLPLYSTLIILCGFSFGLLQGFIISYIAALSGAITVFVLSRSFLKDWMVGLLNKSGGLKKVVRAIEKQPKLLFLVRLAPYPYNLMNTLLASSPTLSLKTYTLCTALALPKLLVHTGLGTSIQNFAAYHGAEATPDGSSSNSTITAGEDGSSPVDPESTAQAEKIKQIAGFVGIGLCIGIFLYLLVVARRAVDELDDEDNELGSSIELDRNDHGEFEKEVRRRNERSKRKGDYFAVHGKDDDDDEEQSDDDDAALAAEKYRIGDGEEDDSDFDSEEDLLSSENEKSRILEGRDFSGTNQHQEQSHASSSSNPLNISSQTLINPSSSSILSLSMNDNRYVHRFSSSTASNTSYNSKDEISLADKIAQMEQSAETYDTGRHRSGSEAAKRGLTGYEALDAAGGWKVEMRDDTKR